MAFNVRFFLLLAVLIVSVEMTSAGCGLESGIVNDELVSDCIRAKWFDTINGNCVKVNPQSGSVTAVKYLEYFSECTEFILIPGKDELHLTFKDGTVFKGLHFKYDTVSVTNLIYSIQLANEPSSDLLNPLTEDFMTTLTFKYEDFCLCLLNDDSIGSVIFEDPDSEKFCGDARCGTRWRFVPNENCGTPPDVENGDKAVDCIYEGCNTTYVCDDQHEIEGDAIAQCVHGEWSPRPTCVSGDPCQNNLCQNGGTCENLGGVAICMCAEGVTGTHCETDCNVAVDEKCENKETIIMKKACNRDRCLFKYGCDQELEEPCGQNGQCVETDGAFRCNCADNFIGGKCQIDVQQCIANRTATCETDCNDSIDKKCQKMEHSGGSTWTWKQQAACSRKLMRRPPFQRCISRCVAQAEQECNNPRCFYNKPRWARFSNKKYGWEYVKKNRTYWGFVSWFPKIPC